MTTVIADRRAAAAMYSDSLCTWRDTSFRTSKIHRIGACVWGLAGDLDNGARFLEWVRSGGRGEADLTEDDFSAMQLSKEGIFLWGPLCTRLEIKEQVFAIGSGAPYALGAMAAGATPEQAIEIAAYWDTATRLPVDVLVLTRSRATARKVTKP